jgi:hypothetical protein
MTVTAEEFLRRFLQHVLPSGFQKVRHYGFHSSRRRATFELVRWLVTLALGLPFILVSTLDADLPDPTTRSLILLGFVPNDLPTFFFDTS